MLIKTRELDKAKRDFDSILYEKLTKIAFLKEKIKDLEEKLLTSKEKQSDNQKNVNFFFLYIYIYIYIYKSYFFYSKFKIFFRV